MSEIKIIINSLQLAYLEPTDILNQNKDSCNSFILFSSAQNASEIHITFTYDICNMRQFGYFLTMSYSSQLVLDIIQTNLPSLTENRFISSARSVKLASNSNTND